VLAVTTESRNTATAFDLAVWLASADVIQQIGPIGSGSLPVRNSQLNTSARWIDPAVGRTESSQLADVVRVALSHREALVVPRIPGSDEYLSALSAAVENSLGGAATAADALGEAARQWDQITEGRGRDAQQRAYLDDLGIAEP
jgi:ABC-type glycerol-3-phosphate transport system substrate-binding protein